MKKKSIIFCVVFLCIVLHGCGRSESNRGCDHDWGEWEVVKTATCVEEGILKRKCKDCSLYEESVMSKGEHKETKLEAVPATCTNTGLTEGVWCPLCETVFTEQKVVDKLEHDYSIVEVVEEATCIKDGVNKFTCAVCGDSYTENFKAKTYSANELYNMALQYVGEIYTFDIEGNAISVGTGFVYMNDGKIITNYHVIDGAYAANITINGITYPVEKVLAYDSEKDLAVIKINASDIPCATLCENAVEVGMNVYAIGSSKGLTNTYSSGIITYVNRMIDDVCYLQHDAAISPGNSGGPLMNEFGEVIAINTMQITDAQNLNFAIFVSELDDIVVSEGITMAEFYETTNYNEVSLEPYDVVLNWIRENKTEYSDSIYYYYETYDDVLYSLNCIEDEEGSLLACSIYIFDDIYDYGLIFYIDEFSYVYYFDSSFDYINNSTDDIDLFGYFISSTYLGKEDIVALEYVGDEDLYDDFIELTGTALEDYLEWFEYVLYEINSEYTIFDMGFELY